MSFFRNFRTKKATLNQVPEVHLFFFAERSFCQRGFEVNWNGEATLANLALPKTVQEILESEVDLVGIPKERVIYIITTKNKGFVVKSGLISD